MDAEKVKWDTKERSFNATISGKICIKCNNLYEFADRIFKECRNRYIHPEDMKALQFHKR
jgi:hypothetical protein